MTTVALPPLEVEVNVDVRWEDRDKRFVARCEMFPQLQGLGLTPRSAVEQLHEIILWWWDVCKKQNQKPF
jgi:hypothetical protein